MYVSLFSCWTSQTWACLSINSCWVLLWSNSHPIYHSTSIFIFANNIHNRCAYSPPRTQLLWMHHTKRSPCWMHASNRKLACFTRSPRKVSPFWYQNTIVDKPGADSQSKGHRRITFLAINKEERQQTYTLPLSVLSKGKRRELFFSLYSLSLFHPSLSFPLPCVQNPPEVICLVPPHRTKS